MEDYLNTVFHLSTGSGVVTSARLAARMGLTPPTVAAMLKRLEVGGLVRRSPEHEVMLTEHGQRHALGVVAATPPAGDVPGSGPRRAVGRGPRDEAEVLEHALSDRLEERIDVLLGRPTHDPHMATRFRRCPGST